MNIKAFWFDTVRRDTLAIILAFAMIVVAASHFEAFEAFAHFSESHESWELDELFVTMTLMPIALLIFAVRRLRESKRALAQRVEAEQQASEMALHDALTGLPNRRKASDELEKALKLARLERVAVLAIDLNRFKPVNDLNGHAVGDQLLIAVGERLCARLGDAGIVCRMGGDEFLVITTSANDEELIRLAKDISASFEQPFDLDKTSYTIGASIGAASTCDPATMVEEFIARADAAMYRCKAAGRNGYAFFEQGMELVAHHRAKIEADLREAISGGQIEAHFQPLVNLVTNQITGFEALARWRLPDGSYRAPVDFISIAEETGLISDLFFSILRQACLETRGWPPDMRVAVNLSPVQFADEWLVGRILAVLVETGVPTGRLEIEITENALVSDFDNARRIVSALREQGIHIALDDFGTGYSSLRHLSELPFDKLKIDQSFIHDVRENSTSEAIVRAVTSLAHELGLSVTAEGIETAENASEIRDMGCDIGQGYHFGRAAQSTFAQSPSEPGKIIAAPTAKQYAARR